MISPSQIRVALLRAADYIEQHGWHQGGAYKGFCPQGNETPPACAYGAIRVALLEDMHVEHVGYANLNAACRVVEDYLQLPEQKHYRRLPLWNDARDRTKDDVIAALRGAAESLEVPA